MSVSVSDASWSELIFMEGEKRAVLNPEYEVALNERLSRTKEDCETYEKENKQYLEEGLLS